MKTAVKRIVWMAVVLVLLAGGYVFWKRAKAPVATAFKTAAVQRGNLFVGISATGTVEPEEVVDVGAQIAGQIKSFGKDRKGKSADYGSEVTSGMILAKIDDALYAADAKRAEADLRAQKALLQNAKATLEQSKAKFWQARQDWERAKKLGPSDALSAISYDGYRSAFESAQAAVHVAEASVQQANAAIAVSKASLERAKTNLGYCTIRSPVNGIIIDRRVNIGQTVVASLNAPSLFLIARDLRKMQVWVAVNEADIGKIYPGQPVNFTVDAFPGEQFAGEVGKVRLNATMSQNVVTYTVEVLTDNSSGRLLPYLTANVNFELERRENVLLVPNAGLKWSPRPEMIDPAYREPKEKGPNVGEEGKTGSGAKKRSVLWTPGHEGLLVPLAVEEGASDGIMTEVSGKHIREGLAVVTGIQTAGQGGPQGTRNPFVPQFFKGGRH
ncbi:efflux RND transporter periplasmic adaptor subunit [Desulfatirhabdium butyrativorans]|uniref:efflux RND transporter periplasmic adaptor subunit n=1 Tax=Desulfatirhabdium butyrativorans TaxID=340467 RepID=UPI000485CF03|nr:efflux RND transporter periplasmic adaptor subunit [Desulfatirhabdium butyrativorans]